MINRILVAVDGSPTSRRALGLAADMAQKYEAELVLLYVIRDMQIPDSVQKMADIDSFMGTRLSAMQMVGQQILKESEEMVAPAGLDKVKTEVRPGDPAGVILRYAEEADMDMIVMGSRGLGNIESALLGSVSRKVTNLSKVPCLTVK